MTIYDQAFSLLTKGDPKSVEDGLALLRVDAENRPSDMKAWFEYAGGFDFLGREAEAAPLYEKVLKAGYKNLPSDDQPRLFVQLGSTYRNLKRFDDSRRLLNEGLSHFPKVAALKLFLALTEYSSGNHTRAMQLVFEVTLDNPSDGSIRDYTRALRWYSENLDT